MHSVQPRTGPVVRLSAIWIVVGNVFKSEASLQELEEALVRLECQWKMGGGNIWGQYFVTRQIFTVVLDLSSHLSSLLVAELRDEERGKQQFALRSANAQHLTRP